MWGIVRLWFPAYGEARPVRIGVDVSKDDSHVVADLVNGGQARFRPFDQSSLRMALTTSARRARVASNSLAKRSETSLTMALSPE